MPCQVACCAVRGGWPCRSRPERVAFGLLHIGALHSLRYPLFRRYFLGQSVSLIGFWLQQVAMSWLIWRLTGSTLWLGAVAFAGSLPMLVVSPFAGVLIDRVDRRRAALLTQWTQMLQAATLALCAFTGVTEPLVYLGLAAVYGVAWAFDAPARQSMLPLMLGSRAALPNAIALNSLVMNIGRFVGPMIAGVLLVSVGEGWCFLLRAASFIAVLPALMALPGSPAPVVRSAWHLELVEGFHWAWSFMPARILLGNLILMSLTVPVYQTLMPVFATEVHGGDARIQGLLTSCAGIGALCGTLMLASRTSVRGLVRVLMAATFVAGASLAVFSFTRHLAVAGLAIGLTGGSIIVCAAATNTVLQSIAEDHRRGRVVSLYAMCFLGMMPLGSLSVGALARHWGPAIALGSFGLICAAGSLFFMTRYPRLREALLPVYQRLGLVEPASGEPPAH